MTKFTNYSLIPKELINLKQWGLFQLKWLPEREKYTKIPKNPYNFSAGKSNDQRTWSDFETALRALHKYPQADGLAFYFANGFVGLDIDHIDSDLSDYEEGDTDPNNLVNHFKSLTHNSYMEISQSGKGLHVIFKGKIPGKHRRHGSYEMYESGRFFALTGNTIGKPKIESLDKSEMTTLYEFCFGKDKVTPLHPENIDDEVIDLPIPEIIKRAEDSPSSGKRFTMFMQGGWEQFYNSQSEADMAFANDLAFWCGRDIHKMDQIFRNSSLIRDKWDRQDGATTYGQRTLQKAINETSNVYSPNTENTGNYIFSFNEKKKQKPKHYTKDDMGMAQRFIDKYGKNFLYSYVDKEWYIYNGSYWSPDVKGYIETAADHVIKNLAKDRPTIDPSLSEKDQQKVLNSWIKFVNHERSHKAKVDLTKELQHRLPVTHSMWDQEDMLLNTPSGYVDLTNGKLHPHDINKMFTAETGAEYTDSIDCPNWQKFLRQIFQDDEEVIHYVQKAIGYSFTGSTKEQVMFIPYGNGRNGKSVMLDTVQDIAGGYAKTMNVSSIMTKYNSNGANSDIARLEGSRMVISSEANEGQRLDEGLVKQLTGGDRIVARQMYGKEFEYTPSYKIWMATNHKPFIRGTDEGIWRRLILIPFDYQVPKDKIDRNLKYKLEAESMGILNWIVEGAIMWQVEGLEAPERIKGASHKYREEMDVLSGFVADCCELGPGFTAKSGELYDSYKNWAVDANEYKMTLTRFGKEMSKKFHRKVKDGYKVYEGIKIKQDTRFQWNK
ncbi:phage/plasmid primase, P4 family [Lactobacillus kefiranofaciens]|uniref:phage/plasmid primase, P4 family n=1 Tax=Lactobacillus kefiranofaciens TaxID=267818 RepID=UPI002468348C|nr:phage/plasmid primase, P4 family [Lactobacillus kefiranofaciens]MDH5099773.1 phage/plasmid primase, P4 family [Lactobacillus kefiranofaciens]